MRLWSLPDIYRPLTHLPEQDREAHDRVASLFDPHAPVTDPEVLAKILSGNLANLRNAPDRLPEATCEILKAHLSALLPNCAAGTLQPSGQVELHSHGVGLRELSDGYASFLALVGHLLRHSLAANAWGGDPTKVRGIALIDEIDAHLHPVWQRRVLSDVAAVFPNLQIIASTHSPIVAGSIDTKSIRVLKRGDAHVDVVSEISSVENWRADQILTSVIFDLPTSRSLQTEQLFRTYANRLQEFGPDDKDVQEMASNVSKAMQIEGEGTVDRATHELLDQLLVERFKNLDENTRRLVLAKAGLVISRKQ